MAILGGLMVIGVMVLTARERRRRKLDAVERAMRGQAPPPSWWSDEKAEYAQWARDIGWLVRHLPVILAPVLLLRDVLAVHRHWDDEAVWLHRVHGRGFALAGIVNAVGVLATAILVIKGRAVASEWAALLLAWFVVNAVVVLPVLVARCRFERVHAGRLPGMDPASPEARRNHLLVMNKALCAPHRYPPGSPHHKSLPPVSAAEATERDRLGFYPE